jgi:dihydrofolate reductase
LDADGGDYGYGAFMATVDGLVMGRNSFDTVAGFEQWPYDKPVIVLSNSLKESEIRPGLAGRVTVSAETPKALMARLERMGWKGVYIDGGKVNQSFLREGLMSDLIFSRIPVLIGDGIPLFGPLAGDIPLRHEKTEAFASGLVQSHYTISAKGGA